MTLLLVGLASFAVGVFVGLMFRDAFELYRTGHGFLLSTSRRVLASRRAGIYLVTAALVVNAALGGLLITTRSAQRDQSDRLSNLVQCLERYNRVSGIARDDRDAAAAGITATELRLWKRFRRMIAVPSDTGGREEALDTIDDYRRKIRHLQQTRTRNPYPDPGLCVDEAR